MKIVEASEELLPGIAKLFDAYRIWYRQAASPEGALQFLTNRLQNNESVIYVAIDEDRPVGFTQLYPLFSSTRMARLWLLNDLYVDPDYRGMGISIQLIDKAKNLVRTTGAAGLSLETEKSNHIGNRLYPRTDFEMDDKHFVYFWKNPEFISP